MAPGAVPVAAVLHAKQNAAIIAPRMSPELGRDPDTPRAPATPNADPKRESGISSNPDLRLTLITSLVRWNGDMGRAH
jgi:hypothetical protein